MPGLLSLRPFASMARADKFFRGGSNEKSKVEGKQQPRTKIMRSKVLPLQNVLSGHVDTHGGRMPENFVGEDSPSCIRGGDESDCQPSSVCFAAMLDSFMLEGEDQQQVGSTNQPCSNGKVDVEGETSAGKELLLVLQGLTPCTSPRERSLLLDVSMFLRTGLVESGIADSSRASQHRKLMMHLRLLGYEAGVCKSRWDHSHGFPGGDYEYLDVVEVSKIGVQNRLLVDIDFRSQFEIARPTADYRSCLQMLPTIFVGKVDRLQKIVDLVSDASRRSLTKRDMHLPPWRKTEYMRSKWLSPYQRVFVDVPALASIGSCPSTTVSKPDTSFSALGVATQKVVFDPVPVRVAVATEGEGQAGQIKGEVKAVEDVAEGESMAEATEKGAIDEERKHQIGSNDGTGRNPGESSN